MKARKQYIDYICLDIGLDRVAGGQKPQEGYTKRLGGGRSKKLLYSIDRVRLNEAMDRISIDGWAAVMDEKLKSQKIHAFLKGKKQELTLTLTQKKRPDVSAAHPEVASRYPGFFTTINISDIESNSPCLKLAIEESDEISKTPFQGEGLVEGIELDQKIQMMKSCDHEAEKEKWFEIGQSFFLYEDVRKLDADPYSDAYRQQQLDLYCRLTGKKEYDSKASEFIELNIADHIDPRPYPCCTGYLDHIGNNLLQVGYIFKALSLEPGSAVLEYGPGGGFTTLLLAASGLDMTVVDINPDCIKIISKMAADRGLKVKTLVGEFGEVPDIDEKFDAVLFFESFHHCLDFEEVLAQLHKHVKDGGKIVFAGEPIMDDYPKPWGLRLDGQSIYEIVSKGWLEMGFREDFFLEMLRRNGWNAERIDFMENVPPTFIATSAG